MADVNGDGNKDTRDGPGKTALQLSLHRPPAWTVCSAKHLGGPALPPGEPPAREHLVLPAP